MTLPEEEEETQDEEPVAFQYPGEETRGPNAYMVIGVMAVTSADKWSRRRHPWRGCRDKLGPQCLRLDMESMAGETAAEPRCRKGRVRREGGVR